MAWFLVEGVAWLAALAVAGRTLAAAPVRRELREKPVIAFVFFAGAGVGLSVAAWLCFTYPIVRRGLAVVLLMGIAVAWIRARPTYGRRRGLPPGSLGLRASLDAISDPHAYRRSSERWGPIFKTRHMHQPVACITDLETGLALFREQGDRLRQSDWAFNRLVPGGYLEYMDGELHTRVRGLFEAAYTPDAVAATQPGITEVTRAQLAALAEMSEPNGVHPEDFLLPIAQVSLLRMVLGVDASHPEFGAIRDRFTQLNQPLELFLPIPRGSLEAYAWLSDKVAELSTGQVRAPSVLATLAATTPLASDPTAIGNLVLMIKEGSIMVRGMLRWIIKMVADHPEEIARIRAVADDASELEARTSAFVRETIRLFESPYLYRRVEKEVQVGDYRVPRGWLVRLCLAEAHSDPDAFPEPDRFLPDRHRADRNRTDRHRATRLGAERFCPFGAGDRVCPGQDIALEIGKTVVRECALGYHVRTVDDGPAWRINRHWGLWRPSLRLHVALEPRRPTAPR